MKNEVTTMFDINSDKRYKIWTGATNIKYFIEVQQMLLHLGCKWKGVPKNLSREIMLSNDDHIIGFFIHQKYLMPVAIEDTFLDAKQYKEISCKQLRIAVKNHMTAKDNQQLREEIKVLNRVIERLQNKIEDYVKTYEAPSTPNLMRVAPMDVVKRFGR